MIDVELTSHDVREMLKISSQSLNQYVKRKRISKGLGDAFSYKDVVELVHNGNRRPTGQYIAIFTYDKTKDNLMEKYLRKDQLDYDGYTIGLGVHDIDKEIEGLIDMITDYLFMYCVNTIYVWSIDTVFKDKNLGKLFSKVCDRFGARIVCLKDVIKERSDINVREFKIGKKNYESILYQNV